MKIEGNGPNVNAGTLQRVDRAYADAPGKTTTPSRTIGTDRVQLSSDAELASRAVKQAEAVPEIRTDLVERMRKQLAAGELGANATRLADKMIDTMLEQK